MGVGLTLAAWVAAGLAGALAHEGAHWLVWRLAGRRPTVDWRKLNARPHAGPAAVTRADRLAAAAPYALGVFAVGVGWAWAWWPAIYFGAFAFGIPSRVDVETMRGRVRWDIDG